MKAKKFMPLVVSLFISSLVSAQTATASGPEARPTETVPSFSMGVVVNKLSNRFDLQISNPGQRRLHLQIHSSNLGTVVDTVIIVAVFNQRYNMEQAEDGQYSIEVSAGKERQVQKIELKTIVTRNMEVIK